MAARSANELPLRVRVGRGGTALLVGWGGAQFLLGWAGVCRSVFDPLPQTTMTVLAAGLLTVALGPWVPQGLIHLVYSPLRRGTTNRQTRFRRGNEPGARSRGPSSDDAADDRVVLVGATCCLLGVLIALSPIFVGVFARVSAYLESRFLWTPVSIGVADGMLAWLSQLPIGALLGLAVVSLLGVEAQRDDRSPGGGRLGGMLIGAGLCCVLVMGPASGLSSRVQLLLASVPLFAAATISLTCLSGGMPASGARTGRRAEAPDLPQADAAGLGVLLVGVAIWSLGVTLAGPVWFQASRIAWGLDGVPPAMGVGLWLAGLGFGAVLFRSRVEDARRTLTQCGLRLWLAGVGTLAAALLLRVDLESEGHREWVTLAGGRVAAGILAQGVLAGQVLPSLLGAAQCRFATRAIAQAVLVTVLAMMAGAGLAFAAYWLLPRYGSLLVISASALGLLMGGGLLIIYEPRRGPWASRGPLGLVFGTLAVMTVVLPQAAAGWRLDQSLTVARAEGGRPTWRAAAVDAGLAETAAATLAATDSPMRGVGRTPRTVEELLTRLVGTGGRMYLIDDVISEPDRGWTRHLSSMDRLLLDGSTGRAGWRGDRLLRRLRLERRQFDLVVVGAYASGDPDNVVLWARETLTRVMRCVSPRGLLVLRVPQEAAGVREAAVLAATFAHATVGEEAVWARPPTALARDEFWLVASPQDGIQTRVRLEAVIGAGRAGPIQELRGAGAVHSLDHPRLRASIARGRRSAAATSRDASGAVK